MARICSPRFSPTAVDVLRARVRTTGIIETCFRINNMIFRYVSAVSTLCYYIMLAKIQYIAANIVYKMFEVVLSCASVSR